MSKQGTSSIYPAIQPPPIPTRRRLGSNKPISTVVPPPVPMRVSSLHDNKLSDTLSSIKTPNIVRKNGADTGNGLLNQGTLMSLSPKNGQNSQNDVNPHSYFNDFKDIDFSFPPDSLKQRRSSSLEDLSVTKSVYPDISHVFREIRNEPDITCGPSFTPVQNLQAGQRNSQTFLCAPAQYGWNPNLFGNDLTANKNGSEANFGSKNFSTTINRLHHGANSVATNMPNAVIGQTSNPNTIMVPMPNPPIIGFIYPCAGAPGNPFNSNPNPGNLPNLNPRHVSGFSDDSSLITRSRNSLPRPASWADTLDSADGFSTWTNKNLDGNDDYGMTPTRPSPDTNLIHLPGRPAEEHEYLSLDYFDPLYNRGRRESISAVLKDISFNYSFGEAFPTFGNLVYPSESRPDFLSQYDHAHGKGIFDPKTIDLVFETTNSPSDDRRSKTDIDTDRPQKRPTLSLKASIIELYY
ncbi:hypothetical protein SNE40_002804 [Patella caerulea]|uniref:Uncharacterized protein n=1 Tax=Patella caerulea TaxID=87958 RepID=A0AAN8K6M4_PATCE